MSANQARFRVATMARVLGVSPSGYYAWRRRPPSARAEADAELTTRVREIHARSRGTYGAPRIHADLADDGVSVGRKRVARVMRAAGIAGVSRRRGPRTTRRAVRARPAPDRVERRFEANEPNRLWAADITYVPTLAGFLYLAIVLDVFSRRVVGWAMAAHLRTALVIEALEMAIAQRRPEAVVHHSDQGCQYTSLAFGARCREWGVALSMGSVGDCFDNAVAESFFATLECELLDRTRLSTHAEARAAVFEFIEGWYNTRRRHSVLGYRSPLEFERLHAGPVDGARPVDALRAPTSPLDPALRAASTPPTGNDVDVQTHDVNSQALTCPRDRGNLNRGDPPPDGSQRAESFVDFPKALDASTSNPLGAPQSKPGDDARESRRDAGGERAHAGMVQSVSDRIGHRRFFPHQTQQRRSGALERGGRPCAAGRIEMGQRRSVRGDAADSPLRRRLSLLQDAQRQAAGRARRSDGGP